MTQRQTEQRIEQGATGADAAWYDYDAQVWYVGDQMQPRSHHDGFCCYMQRNLRDGLSHHPDCDRT